MIPAALRFSEGITAGQEFLIEKAVEGEYRLISTLAVSAKTERPPLEMLRDCLEKDFLMPMEWARRINSCHRLRMIYLLDTNILSEPTKQIHDAKACR